MSGWSAEMPRLPDFVPSTIFIVEIHAFCTFASWTTLTRTCVGLGKQTGRALARRCQKTVRVALFHVMYDYEYKIQQHVAARHTDR